MGQLNGNLMQVVLAAERSMMLTNHQVTPEPKPEPPNDEQVEQMRLAAEAARNQGRKPVKIGGLHAEGNKGIRDRQGS